MRSGRIPTLLILSKRQKRSNGGAIMLVEMMISVLILSIMISTLMLGLSQISTSSTGVQNQVLATNIAQELIDQARNASWATLTAAADGQWHDVGIYAVAMGQPAYLPRQLIYEGTSFFNGGQVSGLNNHFRGTARQQLTNLGNGQVQLVVQVSWPPENGGTNLRTLTGTSYVSQWGIHN